MEVDLRALLAAIEALLREEQGAVAAFDVVAIERITARKNELGERLRALRPRDPGARTAMARVAALAEANSALLSTSANAVAETLGIRVAPPTYDSRARLRRSVNAAPVRVV